MQFLIVRKADPDSEAGVAPHRELIEAMADHVDVLAAHGRFLAGEGLKPSRSGVRVSFGPGRKAIVVDGPFAESRELVAGISIIEAASIEEAVDWVKGWPAEDARGEAVVDIRPIGCPGGLSCFNDIAEGNSDTPRYVVMLKANERSETDWNPGPEILGRMAEANRAGQETGFLIGGQGLSSSRHAKRVSFSKGKATVVDGPFAEIKEMVAGFWVLRVETLDEVIAWTETYPFPDGDDARLEIRELYRMEELMSP
ncbi:YciI family protein [Luteibacter aegosomatis]|uniref:YciI family protein n=1 Tax=Luteibacter aegosomatis TaxID=2911537 RepID=UPI001FFA69C2|nr:YciI family protein [Luteibacter aegosomatis]UPG85897.1 YciI family protein [Luteibacter aegosomatis]